MIVLVLLVALLVAAVLASRRRAMSASPYTAGKPAPAGGGALERPPLQDKLDDWVAAELIDSDQADALLAFEMERAPITTSRVPLAAEAVGYIGSVLVLAAAALVIGNRWDAMSTPARIGSLAVPTVAAALMGWWTGRSDEPALGRLASVLWLLAVVGVAGMATEIWVDAVHDGDPPDHHGVLFVGAITLVAAAPAWWMRRRELQQLAFLAATIATALGVVDTLAAARDRTMSPLAAGLVLLATGTVWLAFGLGDRLPPALLANVSGSALVLIGAQVVGADNDHAGLWLGLVAAMLLMATGVARSELEILFVGTAGLFQWTPQIALFYLGDVLGAEATLFVIGALLIVVAGLFTRIYPRLSARTRDGSGGNDGTATTSALQSALVGSGARHGLPFIVGGCVVALLLVALVSQWFGPTASDLPGPGDDDRGQVQDDEWRIGLDEEGPGIHTVVMIKTFSPLDEADIEDLGGRLIWDDTEVDLCGVGIRSVGERFVQIGDIFQTTEDCDAGSGLQQAFDELGPPNTACVYVRVGGIPNEYCAPLTVR